MKRVNKVSLSFKSKERENLKDSSKVSTFFCSQKGSTNCKFYLEFRCSPETNHHYQLTTYYNGHSHELKVYDTAKSITPEIIQKSTEIMSTTSDTPTTITRIINKYSGLNFDWRTIYYQTNKLKENQFGKRSHNLIKMLQKDVELRGGYYKAEQGSNQELLIVCYMTERMKRIVSTFNDLVIIDGSHGANRFNMQLVDVVVITNLGKTSACFFALLLNQKYESFLWAMKNLKTQLRDQPIVIFSDEEEALVKANFFIHSFFE